MGNYMTQLRKNVGYNSAKEAAKVLGISTSMLYQIEEDIKRPSVKLAIKIMELYKCSLEDIFLPSNTTQSDKDKKEDECVVKLKDEVFILSNNL